MNDTTLSNLSAAELTLLSKAAAVAAKGARPAPGLHSVAPFSVTIGGELSVSEDESYTPTTSIPLLATMVIALHRSGFQRDGIKDLILDAARTAMGTGGKVGDEIATNTTYVKAELKALQLELAAELPAKNRNGKVRVNRADWE